MNNHAEEFATKLKALAERLNECEQIRCFDTQQEKEA